MSSDANPEQDAGTRAVSDWKERHEVLVGLARQRARLEHDEGRALLAALRANVHAHLGFATFAEYVERLLGYDSRQTTEKLRVARALEELPMVDEALRAGQVNWSAARELSRVATRETEAEWLEATADRTAREIERLVAGRRPGDRPGDPPREDLRRYVLRIEVTAETLATYREAVAKLRRDAGQAMDEDAAILTMARAVLSGPADPGRSSYQVALTVCERCDRGWQQGRGEAVAVVSEIVEMAECDAQRIDGRKASQDIPPAVRRLVMRRDGGRCVVPGCRCASFVDVHHIVPRAEGGSHEPANLVVMCAAHHRAVHRGQLWVEGSPETGLVFRHADGTPYGGPVTPGVAEAQVAAFQTLTAMGYGELPVRRALEDVRPHVGRCTDPGLVVTKAVAVLEAAGATRLRRSGAAPPGAATRSPHRLSEAEATRPPRT